MGHNDNLDDALKHLSEESDKRRNDKIKEFEELKEMRAHLEGIRTLADGLSDTQRQKMQELEKKLSSKDKIPEIMTEIDALRVEINNSNSESRNGLGKKIDYVKNTIRKIGDEFNRVSIIDSLKYKTKMWIGGTAIAVASIFAT